MATETIEWHAVTDCLPDEDLYVLIFRPAISGGGKSTWEGYWDGVWWHNRIGLRLDGVTHWADMPAGPRPVDLTQHVIGVPV